MKNKIIYLKWGKKDYVAFWACWKKCCKHAYKALSIKADPRLLLNKYCLLLLTFILLVSSFCVNKLLIY